MARATSAFPTVFVDRAMSQSREAVQPVCARGSGGARSLGAAGPLNRDRGRVEELRPSKRQFTETCRYRRKRKRPTLSIVILLKEDYDGEFDRHIVSRDV